MGSRRPAGYEYRHRFWMDDSVIPPYERAIRLRKQTAVKKQYLFEIQTNFILKRRVLLDNYAEEQQEQVMGSERFAAIVPHIDDSWWLEDRTSQRLTDYWMSIDEIKMLVNEALGFAKQKMFVDGVKYASREVIPVAVWLDVCTVQQEGEPIDAAMDRAIRPERMFPIGLCFLPSRKGDYPNYGEQKTYVDHKEFLMRLARFRPEDDVGLARMEACAICSRDFPAAQVSYLPCAHAFHSHCVFRWFYDGKSSCATCGARVPRDHEGECFEDEVFL